MATKRKREDLEGPPSKKSLGGLSHLLRDLPSSSAYELSFMHREMLSHVAVARNTEFIITASTDGHVKFWRKMPKSIEFVKHYVAHLEPIVSFILSKDDQRLLTASLDKTVKMFEVSQFDMAGMIDLDFVPSFAAWLGKQAKIVVSEVNCSCLRVYDADGDDPSKVLAILDRIHSHPVTTITLVPSADVMISADTKGLIEYWSNDDHQLVSNQNCKLVNFRLKSETDLFELAKARTKVLHLEVAKTGQRFVVTCANRSIMVFDFARGKRTFMVDESAASYAVEGALALPSGEDVEVGSRLKQQVEQEAENARFTATFDKSGDVLMYGCPLGVKMVLLSAMGGKLVRIVATEDTDVLFTSLALYQGVPKIDKQYLLAKKKEEKQQQEQGEGKGFTEATNSSSSSGRSEIEADPVLFMTAYGKKRVYCLSTRLPNNNAERDLINEKLSASELATARPVGGGQEKNLSSEAVLHTSKGDIHVRLFPEECPRTVENFTGHARSGYYRGTTFHRVIKGFMIQGGDPDGDGTGGESIWGGPFEDEFHPKLRHAQPFTLSMANAGPGTNGSQFFITTAPTPHLDDKHTVFGKVIKGFEVVGAIENSPVGTSDRPVTAIKILSID